MKARIGFFKYDLFPYVVTNTITEWTDEGNPKCGMSVFKRSFLIHSLPIEEGQPIAKKIERVAHLLRQREKELEDELLQELYSVASFLNIRGR